MFGAGSIFFTGIAASAGGAAVTADNGLSIDPTSHAVVLGNDFAGPEDGALISFREIDLAGFGIFLDNNGNFASPPERYIFFGQNPFILDGISIQENLTAFPFPGNNRIGVNINAIDVAYESFWARTTTNDGFQFGASANTGTVNNTFQFWDGSGNLTVSDIGSGLGADTGIRFFVYGDIGMSILNGTGNPAKNVGWDTVTNALVEIPGNGAADNGLSIDAVSGDTVLGNDVGDGLFPAQLLSDREIVDNGFHLIFSDSPGSVDNLAINFQGITITDPAGNFFKAIPDETVIISNSGWNVFAPDYSMVDAVAGTEVNMAGFFDAVNAANAFGVIYNGAINKSGIFFLDSGNVQFLNGSVVPVADNGDPFQFSNGASGTFTTTDLKTVTVKSGIVTSIV